MSELSEEVVVGGTGKVWVAATDATAPGDAGTGMDSAEWTELGYLSEAGATINDSKTMTDIAALQSFYAIRRIVTARDTTISFVLRQWNGATVALAFGGGVVEVNSDEYTYTPPAADVVDERSVVVEWEDADKHYRFYVPRAMVTDAVSTTVSRTAAADLPITFGVIASGDTDPYTLFTDDPSFAHVSGS